MGLTPASSSIVVANEPFSSANTVSWLVLEMMASRDSGVVEPIMVTSSTLVIVSGEGEFMRSVWEAAGLLVPV